MVDKLKLKTTTIMNKKLKGLGKGFLIIFLCLLNFVLIIATIFSFGLGYWWLGIILIVVAFFIGGYVHGVLEERSEANFRRLYNELEQKNQLKQIHASLEKDKKEIEKLHKDEIKAFIKSLNDKSQEDK